MSLLGAASGQVGGPKLIKPTPALYLVAVPLFDMVLPRCGKLFAKGRLRSRSLSHCRCFWISVFDRRALVMIVTINLAATGLGLLLHRLNAPDYYQRASLLACSCCIAC